MVPQTFDDDYSSNDVTAFDGGNYCNEERKKEEEEENNIINVCNVCVVVMAIVCIVCMYVCIIHVYDECWR